MIAGIEVGTIERISLWGDKARVDIRIKRGVTLYQDAGITKKSASLLGEYLLAIYPGTPTQPKLHDGDQIATARGATTTDDILSSVSSITASVQRIVM